MRKAPKRRSLRKKDVKRDFFKPFFLDKDRIGPLIGQRLGSAGIHGSGESEEYVVREKEVWHRYDLTFEDRYDLDAIAPIYNRYIDPAVAPFYDSFSILKVKVAIVNDDGDIIAEGVRSVTAIFEYKDIKTSIAFNVKTWVKKGEYDTVIGMILELRTPEWYERKRIEEIAQ